MSTSKEQIAALELFNEKAAELMELSFVRAIADPKVGFTIRGQAREDGLLEMQSEVRGPSKEATMAFVLIFRFFIQDNEVTSFRNLSKLYEVAQVEKELKERFRSARIAVNEMLDSPNLMNFDYNGAVPTN